MAAPSRAANPADARIPCPLCSGLIHPIAGRCKHCKGDLSAMRGARPAAVAALPPLHAQAHPAVPPPAMAPVEAHGHVPPPAQGLPPGHGPGHGNGVANGHAPYAGVAPPPYVPPMAALHEASHAILPPRPTGRMPVVQHRPAGWWKSWPVIVIVLAGLAIVTAVILMVWPPGGSEDTGSQGLKPPPAPERMDTNPLPPPSRGRTGGGTGGTGGASRDDPWGTPRRGAVPSPADPTPTPSPPSIDIPDDPDPAPDDDFRLDTAAAMTFNIIRRACKRLRACDPDSDTTKMICEQADSFPAAPVPACAAARRCLEHIDQLECSATTDANAILTLTNKVGDCMDAQRC